MPGKKATDTLSKKKANDSPSHNTFGLHAHTTTTQKPTPAEDNSNKKPTQTGRIARCSNKHELTLGLHEFWHSESNGYQVD